MPIERFRDPMTGRWTRRESGGLDILRELFGPAGRESQELIREGRAVREYGEIALPNWTEKTTQYGETWLVGNGTSDLDPEALSESSAPFGASAFRLRYSVPNNPRYGGGYASSDWFSADEWPPDESLGGDIGATGIVMVHWQTY